MDFKNRKKGVITVFVSLLLVGVLSFTSTITEGVRIYGARMQAQIASDCAVDSLLSEYETLLMENYNLFFKNGMEGESVFLQENMEADMKEYMSHNLSPQRAHALLTHSDFWRLEIRKCLVKEYRLATDNDCSAYREQAADCVKGIVGAELLKQLMEWEKDPINVNELEEALEEREKENLEQLQQAKEEATANPKSTEENTTQNAAMLEKVEKAVDSLETDAIVNEKENPIAIIKEIKEKGILQLVMPKDVEVSDKKITTDDLVSKRSLNTGNAMANTQNTVESIEEKILFHEYLHRTFSCAIEKKESTLPNGQALDYELEYMIVGKDSDIENLKYVVHSILIIREAMNYGYLLSDTVKQLQAETLAVAITSAIGMLPLKTVVQHGILLAWAYGESIMDVRQLMAGGKVPFIKTEDGWQLTLENFGSLLQGNSLVQKKEEGISYEEYLRILLFAQNEKKLTLRSLDVIEQSMRKQPGGSEFMADGLVSEFIIETTFWTKPMFYQGLSVKMQDGLCSYVAVSKGQYMK